MPTTTEEIPSQRARFSNRPGAGGDPLREPPARLPGILDSVPDDMTPLPYEVVDELLAGARTGEEIVERGGLLAQVTKRLVERALEARNNSARRRCRPSTRPSRSARPGIATGALSPSWMRSVSGALKG